MTIRVRQVLFPTKYETSKVHIARAHSIAHIKQFGCLRDTSTDLYEWMHGKFSSLPHELRIHSDQSSEQLLRFFTYARLFAECESPLFDRRKEGLEMLLGYVSQ